MSRLTRVDLPAPVVPTSAMVSPGRAVKLIFFRVGVLLLSSFSYVNDMFEKVTSPKIGVVRSSPSSEWISFGVSRISNTRSAAAFDERAIWLRLCSLPIGSYKAQMLVKKTM